VLGGLDALGRGLDLADFRLDQRWDVCSLVGLTGAPN